MIPKWIFNDNEDKNFYVYAYLDPRKKGNFVYNNFVFSHEPFYVGKGCKTRYKPIHHMYSANTALVNKIRKIGMDNVIVSFELSSVTEKEAFSFEMFLTFYIGQKNEGKGPLLNLTNGGGGCSGRKLSVETRRKIGEKSKLKVNTVESNLKRSEALKGKFTGAKSSMFGVSPANKGKKMSAEFCQKLKDAWKKRKLSLKKEILNA